MEHVNCPSCGAALNPLSPLTKMVTCEYCATISVIREDRLSIKNKQSGLTPSLSGLKVGDSGHFEGKSFSVLGRVRYRYSTGFWDEWYLRFNDGKGIWLSEDEGEFSIEERIEPTKTFTNFATTELGEPISFGSWTGSIDEFDEAECCGFQGELPEEFDLGEKMKYAEGSGDGQIFTVEEDEDGVQFFQGKHISKDQIRIH